MTVFQIIAIILTLTALGGYVNHRYIRLPASIGMMAFSLLMSIALIVVGQLGFADIRAFSAVVSHVDFSDILLHGMLSFLLFAGALHINLDELHLVRLPVAVLATVGVVISTFVTGTLVWYAAALIDVPLPYLYALLFGALISPTDPIAVLAILKQYKVPNSIYMKIGGESLFNDGIGVVMFMTILGVIQSPVLPDVSDVTKLLVREAFGGGMLGIAIGYLTYLALRSINDYKIEVLMTLALVSGGYALAEAMHVSAPICMVLAGLVVGNHGRNFGMSEESRQRLDDFWELLDEILNAVLFLLIGLEIIVLSISYQHVELGLLTVVAVLMGRFVSVALPITALRAIRPFEKGTIGMLTWGGLRGGLSIAMALSIPAGAPKEIILPVTYVVVLFSIFGQGLTFKYALEFFRK